MTDLPPDTFPTGRIFPGVHVHFSDQSAEGVETLLDAYPEELTKAERRLEAARVLLGREEELAEWLRADPSHARLLLNDPAAALSAVAPQIDTEVSIVGRGLAERLGLSVNHVDTGVVVFNPPEVLALQLLRDVANEAGGRPNGYAALLADIEGFVAAVGEGRFPTDVIALTVAGIARAFEVSGTHTSTSMPSGLLAFLDENPAIAERWTGAHVEEANGGAQ